MQFDPTDPGDARIIARQVTVARQSGRDGLDRAAATRGRADLEAAYDEGAVKASAPVSDKGGKRGKGGRKPADGSPSAPPAANTPPPGPSWQDLKPRSPARPPTRAKDAGGFITGLALYTVAIIYVRYGPVGWKWWLSAKFLNKPLTSSTSGGTASKPKAKKGGVMEA